jgi:hypothetical protein
MLQGFALTTPVPTKFQFQFQTSIQGSGPRAAAARAFLPRESDLILKEIGNLLDGFHASTDGPARTIYLGKMLYTADRWLKHPPGDDRNRRIAGMQDFRASVLNRLMEDAKIPEMSVKTWLERTFGAYVNSVMAKSDKSNAAYYETDELEQYRLRIVNGIVYARKWWEKSVHLTLFDTANQIRTLPLAVTEYEDRETTKDFANYVLTMDGEFYSTWHRVASSGAKGRFHSAYMRGNPVHCAGEMRVKNGLIAEINNKSGHYTPGTYKLRDAVEALEMLGVNFNDLVVKDFTVKSDQRPARELNARHFLNTYAPRYILEGQPRDVVLRHRAAGIEDVVLAPLFREPPPWDKDNRVIDNYVAVLDVVERLLVTQFEALAPALKLRIVPLPQPIRQTLNISAGAPSTHPKWGADFVVVPSFVFDTRKIYLPRLILQWFIGSLEKSGDSVANLDFALVKNPEGWKEAIDALVMENLQEFAASV